MLQRTCSVKQTEQQRTNQGAIALLVPAKSSDYAVAIALVFDLEHDTFIRLIGTLKGLGDHSVEACTFEALKPVQRNTAIGSCRC